MFLVLENWKTKKKFCVLKKVDNEKKKVLFVEESRKKEKKKGSIDKMKINFEVKEKTELL